MADAIGKLQSDVKVLEAMAERMDGYLKGNTLFGVMGANMPRLTIGGYLMRQHRLVLLKDLLPMADQLRVDKAVETYRAAVENAIVRSEKRATEELGARLRQWEAFIRDLRREPKSQAAYYGTAVEARVIVSELLLMLTTPPYQLHDGFLDRVDLLDAGLRGVWEIDERKFVWPAEWEPAYPFADFWYLYGYSMALSI